jgi:monovalent cation:H+ antiporter-2, CPA2 family
MGVTAWLPEIVALLVGGTAVAFVAFALGIVPIVGFLLAGILIGPGGIGLVRDPDLVNAAAEVGVILLLFTIGIQFSLGQLARIQRLIFAGGGLQVGLATAVTSGIAMALGVSWPAAVFTGLLVALTSSTAIVLKLLADRNEMETLHGQAGLGLLIFQDLATVAAFFLVPILAGQGGSPGEIGVALLKAGAVVAVVLLLARRLMPPVLERVARTCSPEIFLLTVISICFGTAWLTSLMGLSLSLGAFLAGLIVSESEFSQHAMMEILPLQILFSATFFVSVGMLVDVRYLLANLPLVLGVVVAVMAIKAVTTGVAVRALGYRLPVAALVGALLAQVGEFGFVLVQAGAAVGLTPGGAGETGIQVFTASSVLLMVLTPLVARGGEGVARRWEGSVGHEAALPGAPEDGGDAGAAAALPLLQDHVIVAGFGAGARRLVPVLRDRGIPVVVGTLSPAGAREAESGGVPSLRADYARPATLHLLGVERARALVVVDDDPARARQVVTVARMETPGLRILVRTRYASEVEGMISAGATLAASEEVEGLVRVAREAGRAVGLEGPGELEALVDALRAGIGGGAPFADGPAAAGATRDAPASPDFHSPPPVTPGDLAMDPSWPYPHRRPLDTEVTVELRPDPRSAAFCGHLEGIQPVHPSSRGCEECVATGDEWVHLRICMTCGHVGCCDSSKNRHATKHHHATGHPIVRSMEPGEGWGWCYVDRTTL